MIISGSNFSNRREIWIIQVWQVMFFFAHDLGTIKIMVYPQTFILFPRKSWDVNQWKYGDFMGTILGKIMGTFFWI